MQATSKRFEKKSDSQSARVERERVPGPEPRVPDLVLRQHLDGSWPSSRNVSQ